MPKSKNIEKKTLDELCKDMTATEILYLLGETLLLDIDEQAEVEYAEGEQPQSFEFKMKNSRVLSVLVTEVTPSAK